MCPDFLFSYMDIKKKMISCVQHCLTLETHIIVH